MNDPTLVGPIATRPRASGWAAALVALASAAGCEKDDGLGRLAISGEATLDGRPLAAGSILFDPESERVGTAVGTLIRGGRFSIPREEGPAPGRYLVRIYASSDVQAPPPAGVSERAARPMVELIPAGYNSQTTLVADVTRGGANVFKFATRTDAPTPPPDRASRGGPAP